jgi:Immunity protein 50
MHVHERIEGAAKLISIFGYWPSFHDAEVLWVRLDRGARNEMDDGPTLDALIHAFEMTSEVGPDGFFKLRHHVLVHFRFHGVVELSLEGFNEQNALWDLSIAEVQDRRTEGIDFEVTLSSAYGLSGLFQCRRVEVKDVAPCTQEAVPL